MLMVYIGKYIILIKLGKFVTASHLEIKKVGLFIKYLWQCDLFFTERVFILNYTDSTHIKVKIKI